MHRAALYLLICAGRKNMADIVIDILGCETVLHHLHISWAVRQKVSLQREHQEYDEDVMKEEYFISGWWNREHCLDWTM